MGQGIQLPPNLLNHKSSRIDKTSARIKHLPLHNTQDNVEFFIAFLERRGVLRAGGVHVEQAHS